MKETTVSQKGWVVIPKEIRELYGLTPGTKVRIVDYAGRITIVPVPDDPVAALRGMFAAGPNLVRELAEERRKEREREDAKVRRLSSGTKEQPCQ